MPQLIIGGIIIVALIYISGLAITALGYVFSWALAGVVLCSINLLALFDRMLGPVGGNTSISWGLSGIIIGSLSYFAISESHKLYRPAIKVILILCCIAVLAGNFYLSTHKPSSGVSNYYSNQKIGLLIADTNIRSSPSNRGNVIYKIKKGASITILSSKGEWYHSNYNNIEGYIKTKYVKLEHTSTTK